MRIRNRDMNGEMTLVEKAAGYKGFKPVIHGTGNDHYELAAAWVNGELTNSQVAFALGLRKTDEIGLSKGNNLLAIYRMAAYLREAVKRNKLEIAAK